MNVVQIKKTQSHAVTRFAPSPTGLFHIGAVRTALFNYAFAKKRGGKMILRIEDTDRARSKKEYEDDILEGLKWLGISFEGPYRQSERGEIYKSYLLKLFESGDAYWTKEGEEEKGGTVIRFKNPNKKVRFSDVVRGEIEFDTTELKDFVIARTLENPLFHFAVVVDDHEMGITHLIRGEDHISNTPRQILIQEALGITPPVYAHLPLVLAHDKSKLSKRNLSQGVAVRDYRKAGYLPDAIANFVALLGWSPAEEGKEIFTTEELVGMFTLERIQKGNAQFDAKRLRWINSEHMKKLKKDELFEMITAHIPEKIKNLSQYKEERLRRSVKTIIERIEVFADIARMSEEGELQYLFSSPIYENPKKIISQKEDAKNAPETKKHLENIIRILSNIAPEHFDEKTIKEAVWNYATEYGRGNVLWPMRYSLSGCDTSPDPFILADILGKNETLVRLETAREALTRAFSL